MNPELRFLLRLAAAPSRFAAVTALAAVSEALDLREVLGQDDGNLIEDLDAVSKIEVLEARVVATEVVNLHGVAAEALEVARHGLTFALRCLELLRRIGLNSGAKPAVDEMTEALKMIASRLPRS